MENESLIVAGMVSIKYHVNMYINFGNLGGSYVKTFRR